MPVGLVGRKCGMTRIFTEDGNTIPVTVIEVSPNRVTQVKTVKNDGYRALQITAGTKKQSRIRKPQIGHFVKANVEPGDVIREFRLAGDEYADAKQGDQLTIDLFSNGQKVDVSGVSKGKGFAGAVKRHNFKTQDATHGNSLSHRAPGSIGQCQTPGRVFKGKKMAGQLGSVNCTTQNLEVAKVDVKRQLLLIKGAVAGAPGGVVVVTPAVKQGGTE